MVVSHKQLSCFRRARWPRNSQYLSCLLRVCFNFSSSKADFFGLYLYLFILIVIFCCLIFCSWIVFYPKPYWFEGYDPMNQVEWWLLRKVGEFRSTGLLLWLYNILEPLGQTVGVPQKQADVYIYLPSIKSVVFCFGYLPAEGCGVLLGT